MFHLLGVWWRKQPNSGFMPLAEQVSVSMLHSATGIRVVALTTPNPEFLQAGF